MHARNSIALVTALLSSSAVGQPVKPPEPTQAPVAPMIGPVTPAQSAPGKGQPQALTPDTRLPDLVPLSPDFQAAMANSQLQTYRYSQLTEQALALKKLCDTGFGPSDICPRSGGGATSQIANGISATGTLPTISEIDGVHGALSAVLTLEDGRHVTVHPGALLPDGTKVVSITEDDVRVSTGPGRETALYFGGIGASR
jgi:type IV pilus biogenesis protein PilP